MIKRILKFELEDWKHIGWLIKNMIKNILLAEFEEANESILFIKLHLFHDNNSV